MRIINTTTEYVTPDNPMTAEEIVDLCCEEVPFDPCAKEGRVSPYSGADQEDWSFDPDQELAKAAADNPKIISVSTEGIGNRPGEPCGQKYETWKGKNDCCDFVEPMEWDEANSAEVVAPGSRVIVGITGGRPPFYVTVRGEGFTLDGYRIRNGWADTRMFWVYAADFSCGWCQITVDDGCSVAEGGVRSTNGVWSQIPVAYLPGWFVSVVGGPAYGNFGWRESIRNDYMVRQRYDGRGATGTFYFYQHPFLDGQTPGACGEAVSNSFLSNIFESCAGFPYTAYGDLAQISPGLYCVSCSFIFQEATGPLGPTFFGSASGVAAGTEVLAYKWVC